MKGEMMKQQTYHDIFLAGFLVDEEGRKKGVRQAV